MRPFAFFMVIALGLATASAQDRVTVSRDDDAITLSNRYLQVTITPKTAAIGRVRYITSGGAVTVMEAGGRFLPYVSPVGPGVEFYRSTVIERDDGSITVAMLNERHTNRRITTCITMLPDVASITWTGRDENLSQSDCKSDLIWLFEQPRNDDVMRLHGPAGGWYLRLADVNVMLTGGPSVHAPTLNEQARQWRLAAERMPLPLCVARSGRVTIGVTSGIGPVNAAGDAAAISQAKDADGQWMIAVAPFGRLINAEITVTSGLKTYRQTINAGPGEPFIVNTPLTGDKIDVTLRSAKGDVLLPPPPEVAKSSAENLDIEAVGKQRVEQFNDALKAMAEKRWAEALALSGKSADGCLWMKLIGALAEQQAGHDEESKKLLLRIVADDPAAAEAWWLLGEKDRAGALDDPQRIEKVVRSLQNGHQP